MDSFLKDSGLVIPPIGPWRINERTQSQQQAQDIASERLEHEACGNCGGSQWTNDEFGGVHCALCGSQLVVQRRDEHADASQAVGQQPTTGRSRRMRGRANTRDTRVTLISRPILLRKQPSVDDPGFTASLSKREARALGSALTWLLSRMCRAADALMMATASQLDRRAAVGSASAPTCPSGSPECSLCRARRHLARRMAPLEPGALEARSKAIWAGVLRLYATGSDSQAGSGAADGPSGGVGSGAGRKRGRHEMGADSTTATATAGEHRDEDEGGGSTGDRESDRDSGGDDDDRGGGAGAESGNLVSEARANEWALGVLGQGAGHGHGHGGERGGALGPMDVRVAALPPFTARGLLPVLLLALQSLQLPVGAFDVCSWAGAGLLPFLRAWLAVPGDLVGPLWRVQGALLPRQVPGPEWVERAAGWLAGSLGMRLGLPHALPLRTAGLRLIARADGMGLLRHGDNQLGEFGLLASVMSDPVGGMQRAYGSKGGYSLLAAAVQQVQQVQQARGHGAGQDRNDMSAGSQQTTAAAVSDASHTDTDTDTDTDMDTDTEPAQAHRAGSSSGPALQRLEEQAGASSRGHRHARLVRAIQGLASDRPVPRPLDRWAHAGPLAGEDGRYTGLRSPGCAVARQMWLLATRQRSSLRLQRVVDAVCRWQSRAHASGVLVAAGMLVGRLAVRDWGWEQPPGIEATRAHVSPPPPAASEVDSALRCAAASLALAGAAGCDPGQQAGAQVLAHAAEVAQRVVDPQDRPRGSEGLGVLRARLRGASSGPGEQGESGPAGWVPPLVDALAAPGAAGRLFAGVPMRAQRRELHREQRVAALGLPSVGPGMAASLPPAQREYRRARLQGTAAKAVRSAAAGLLAAVSFRATMPGVEQEGGASGAATIDEKAEVRDGLLGSQDSQGTPRSFREGWDREGEGSKDAVRDASSRADWVLVLEMLRACLGLDAPSIARLSESRHPGHGAAALVREVVRDLAVEDLEGLLGHAAGLAATACLCDLLEHGECTIRMQRLSQPG